jgi:hypothetical protein
MLIVSSSYPPPAPPQALQFIADPGFQNVLPPFRTVSDYYMPVTLSHYIYILFKILPPYFTLALLYFLLSFLLLRFVVSFVGFTWFSMSKNLKNCTPHVTFEILTELKLNISVSCNMMPCSLVEIYRSFGRRNIWIFSANWVFFRLSTQFYPQNGVSAFRRNVCEFLPECTASYTLHYSQCFRLLRG